MFQPVSFPEKNPKLKKPILAYLALSNHRLLVSQVIKQLDPIVLIFLLYYLLHDTQTRAII